MSRVRVILGQQRSEMSGVEGEYKARCVLGGHDFRTTDGRPARELFQEVSGSPSAMNSSRGVLGAGALLGDQVSVRDAESAYIQASINKPGRPQTWVKLPRDLHPAEWCKNGACIYQEPVVFLDEAFYGHPESGALWECHLSSRLKQNGWKPITEHPGLYR